MQTIVEYLQELENQLKYLPKKEIRSVVKSYQTKINNALDYGEKEEKILRDLPTPEEVAKNIYDAQGINYKDQRSKQLKQKAFIDAISSLILATATLLIFVGIFAYIGYMIYSLAITIPTFFSYKALEAIIMVFFLVAYILVTIVSSLYIIDLMLLLVDFLLERFFRIMPKAYEKFLKFKEFSFNGLCDKLTKKSKSLSKIFGITFIIFIALGIMSVVTKTYLYRALMDIPGTNHIEEVLLNDDVSEIKIENYEMKVRVLAGEELKIKYQSEFNRAFTCEIINGVAVVTTNNSRSIDFFNLLKEPVHLLTITVPNDTIDKLTIDIAKGTLAMEDVEVEKMDLEINSGKVALQDLNTEDFTLVTNKADVYLSNSVIEKATFSFEEGLFTTTNDKINDLTINNRRSNIGIKELNTNNFTFNNDLGTVVVEKMNSDNFNYLTNSSINNINNFTYKTAKIETRLASEITLNKLEGEELTGIIPNGFIKIANSLTDADIDALGGNVYLTNVTGDIDILSTGTKMEVYDCITSSMIIDITNCQAHFENLKIDDFTLKTNDVIAIMIDIVGDNFTFDLNRGSVELYNNENVGKITRLEIKRERVTPAIDDGVIVDELVWVE